MRKDKTLNSKNYNKEMSQIVNLILQLKQLDNDKKHNKPKISFGKKKIIENRTGEKKDGNNSKDQ